MSKPSKAEMKAEIAELQTAILEANRKRIVAENLGTDALQRLDRAHDEIRRLQNVVENERDKRGDLIMETQQAIPLVIRLMTAKRPKNNEFDHFPF